MTRWIAPFLLVLASAGFLLVHPATRPDSARIYERAERAYFAGDIAGAERLCRRALFIRSDHAPARALLSEVEFVLGHRPATPADYGRYWESKFGITRSQGTEIVLTRVEKALDAGDFTAAEDDLRRVLASLHESPTSLEKGRQMRRCFDALRRLAPRDP